MASLLTCTQCDVIRQLLVDGGLGTDPEGGGAWPAHADGEPDRPDNCLTVRDTVGTDDGRLMGSGELVSHYGFQVRIRATDPQTGKARANAIRTYLSETVYQFVVTVGDESYFVQAVTRIGQILPLGKDAPNTKRSLFTLNATVALRPTTEDAIVTETGEAIVT